MQLSSSEICKLQFNTIVTVNQVNGTRCHISAPCKGWVSITSLQKCVERFVKHMTLQQAVKLRVGDKIDHQNDCYNFWPGIVEEINCSSLKIHYEGKDEVYDEWCDYKEDLHRFAIRDSITKRKAHRLTELKIKDWVNVNPVRFDPDLGWVPAQITEMDSDSGQIQVVLKEKYSDKHNRWYWVHLDNIDEVRPLQFLSCHKEKDTLSEHLDWLMPGTIVTVEEIDGDRCRISSPLVGWISMVNRERKTQLVKLSEVTTVWRVRRRTICRPRKHKTVEYPIWHNQVNDQDFDGHEELFFDAQYTKAKLIPMDLKSKSVQQVIKDFHSSVDETLYEITKIEGVQNKYLWDRYCDTKSQMTKILGKEKLNEMNLWKGNVDCCVYKDINQGFKRENASSDNCPDGIDLACNANAWLHVGGNKMIYCSVLCGEYCIGSKDIKFTNWPLTEDKNHRLYDSLIRYSPYGNTFYIRDDAQVYPMFVIEYNFNETSF